MSEKEQKLIEAARTCGPAFPPSIASDQVDVYHGQDGMTYYQWLIGQALCGRMANSTAGNHLRPAEDEAEKIIQHVDALMLALADHSAALTKADDAND